jgi:uncharacterized protein (DUF305 family)
MGIRSRMALLSIFFCALALHGQQRLAKHPADKSAADPTWGELNSSMERMHVATSLVSASGNCDVDFVRLMVPHHQAAIDMAKTELLYGKSPELRRLAQEIITDQQSEIELMNLWLKQHPSSASNGFAQKVRKADE